MSAIPEIYAIDIDSDRITIVIDGDLQEVGSIRWKPDGNSNDDGTYKLLSTHMNGTVRLFGVSFSGEGQFAFEGQLKGGELNITESLILCNH
jgi:hypothetical protein